MAGWTSVEEIVAYQLAVKLRDRILAVADAGIFAADWKFRDQLTSAARSVPANIAEGFALYKHGRFSSHVDIALGSLGEIKTHLLEANTRGFLTDAELDDLLKLREEVRRTTTGLQRHLRTTDAPEPGSGSHIAVPKRPRKRR
jgi:four helix bundle protein